MKIYVDKKPEFCCNCILYDSKKIKCLNLDKKIDNIYSVLNDCPLIELKPEELKWKNTDDKVYISGKFRIHYVPFSMKWLAYYDGKTLFDGSSELNKAKQVCQNFGNNLFWEMLGVNK